MSLKKLLGWTLWAIACVLSFRFVTTLLNFPSDAAVGAGVLAGVTLAWLLGRLAKRIWSYEVKKIATLIVALSFMGLSACTRIPPGHVGIVVNQWGSEKGVSDYTPKTGQFMYNPLTTSVFDYPTYMQNVVWTLSPHEGSPVDESITFTIKGNMAINVDVSLAYDLTPEKVPHFYVQFRNDDLQAFTDGFMRNVARDSFNDLGGKYELDQIMGDNADFIKAVEDRLQARVVGYGVNIKQFGIIGAPRPPKEVQAAITAKIGATQLAIQKQNELVQAQADAAKVVAKAKGDAEATLLLAQTQAKSNQLLNDSLTDKLVQYRAIDKWNGVLPTFTGGGAVPFVNVK